jgi:hypothetical protein
MASNLVQTSLILLTLIFLWIKSFVHHGTETINSKPFEEKKEKGAA